MAPTKKQKCYCAIGFVGCVLLVGVIALVIFIPREPEVAGMMKNVRRFTTSGSETVFNSDVALEVVNDNFVDVVVDLRLNIEYKDKPVGRMETLGEKFLSRDTTEKNFPAPVNVTDPTLVAELAADPNPVFRFVGTATTSYLGTAWELAVDYRATPTRTAPA